MKLPFYISFFLLTYSITTSYSQSYTAQIQHYTTEQGLSHREAHVIFEDSQGFIWIGTRYGLNRFDGTTMKVWTKEENGYNFNLISRIGEDDEGWLWFWNNEEIIFLHTITEEIRNAQERFGYPLPYDPSYKTKFSWKFWNNPLIHTDAKGRLYLNNEVNNEIYSYHSSEGFQKIIVEDLTILKIEYVTPEGIIWVESEGQLYQVGKAGEIITSYDFGEAVEDVNVQGRLNNILYVFTLSETEERYHAIFENGQDTLFSNYIPTNYLQLNTALNHIWNRTSNGFDIYNPNFEKIHTISKQEIPKSAYDDINHFYTDSKGRVWLATDFGVVFVNIQPNKFKLYFSFLQDENRPFYNSTRGIAVDSNSLVANFEMGGLVQLNATNSTNDVNLLDRSIEGRIVEPIDQRYDYWGRPILKSTKGGFWIGGKFELRYLPNIGEAIKSFKWKQQKGVQLPVDIWSLYETVEGHLWMGTGGGLTYKLNQEDTLGIFTAPAPYQMLNEAFVLHILEKNARQVWICTDKGLFLFDLMARKIVARYGEEEQGAYFLPTNKIQYLHQDSKGIYWLASPLGLIRWDKKAGMFKILDTKDGLSNNNIYAIYEDKYEQLWLSSDYGIMQFDKTTQRVKTYLPKDGTTHYEFNRISHYQAADESIYFGSMNGITGFHPDDFSTKEDTSTTLLRITGFEYYDGIKDTLINHQIGELRQTRTFQMKPNDLFFTIQVALLSFGESDAIQYAYKIKGVVDEWITPENGKILLTRLPYGEHILTIRAKDSGRAWAANQMDINIIMERPLYLKAWFVIIAFLSIVFLLIYIYKKRTERLKKRQLELESEIHKATVTILSDKQIIEQQVTELSELNYIKDRIFAVLGHDLRKPALSFRNLSKKLAYLIQNKDFDTLNKIGYWIEQDANALHQLTDNILQWGLMQQNGVTYHPTDFDVSETIDEILYVFKRAITEKKLVVQNLVTPETILYADPNSMSTVIRNLIDNAIKFTPKEGFIYIRCVQEGEYQQLQIEDKGVGIAPQKLEDLFALQKGKSQKGTAGEKGTGIGLHLVKELIKSNKGTLNVKSTIGKGTTFTIVLPSSRMGG